MLRLDDTAVAFRHELARQAIEVALSPEWARSLHRRALEALMGQTEHPFPTARLVHHALHAGDAELIVRFAPIAAQEAVAQGAHREAAVQYATALRFADAHVSLRECQPAPRPQMERAEEACRRTGRSSAACCAAFLPATLRREAECR